MGKPSKEVYERFITKYHAINKKLGKKQFVVPYLMSSHPGSDLNAAIELGQYIKSMGHMPEQVQDFYPTPGSLSTTIYYTGINPFTNKKVYVTKSQKEKNMQRALLQFGNPENHNLVKSALISCHREDLIGNGKNCLIPTNPIIKRKSSQTPNNKEKSNVKNTNLKKSSKNTTPNKRAKKASYRK